MSDKKKEASREKIEKLKARIRNTKPTTTPKRLKALVSFVDVGENNEVRQVLNENPSNCVSLLLDTFNAYVQGCLKGKRDQAEVQHMIAALRALLAYCGPFFKKKNQFTEPLLSFLEKLLWKENKSAIRLPAVELLMTFLDIYENATEQEASLVASSLNVIPYTIDYVGMTHRNILGAVDKNTVLVPSSSIATKAETTEFLGVIMDFMHKHPSSFEFWFGIFKNLILTTFYPAKCKEIGLLDSSDNSGFYPSAPGAIQACILEHLDAWFSNETIVSVCWGSPQNVALMMEIYRHGLALPIGGTDEVNKKQYNDVIRRAIRTYQTLLMVALPFKAIQQNSVAHRRFFLDQFKHLFMAPVGTGDRLQAHLKLCFDLIEVFKSILETCEIFEQEITEAILTNLLDITTSLLSSSAQKPLAEKLVSTLVETTLWAWIRARSNSDKIWNMLHAGISGLFHIPEVIVQLRTKCQQLSSVLIAQLFPRAKDTKETVKAKLVMRRNEDSKGDEQKVPELTAAQPDTVSSMQWDVDSVRSMWLRTMHVMKTVNKITDPAVHATIMGVLTEVIFCVMKAEQQLSVEEYQASWAIIEHSSNIFSIGLQGASILVPCYMNEIRRIFRPEINTPAPVRKKALHILGSLISYGNHFKELDAQSATSPVLDFKFADLTRNLYSLLADIFAGDSVAEHKVLCVYGLSVMLQEELANQKPSTRQLLSDILRNVISATVHQDDAVNLAAIETLSSLSALTKQLEGVDENFSWAVVDALAGNLQKRILEVQSLSNGSPRQGPGKSPLFSSSSAMSKSKSLSSLGNLITLEFGCLLDWLMAAPSKLLDGPLATKVFELIGLALVYPESEQPAGEPTRASMMGKDDPKDLEKKRDTKNQKKEKKKEEKEKESKAGKIPKSESMDATGARVEETKEDVLEEVKETARGVLLQLSNYFNKFPPKEGAELMGSMVDENSDLGEDNLNTLFFTYNEEVVLSFVQIAHPSSQESIARVIVRDPSGRYAWDAVTTNPPPQMRDPPGLPLAKLRSYLAPESLPAATLFLDQPQSKRRQSPSPSHLAAAGSQLPFRKSTSFSFRGPLQNPEYQSLDFANLFISINNYFVSYGFVASFARLLTGPSPESMVADEHHAHITRVPSFRMAPEDVSTAGTDQLEQLLRYLGESHPDILWGERKLREVLHEPCTPLEENILPTQATERALLDQITEDLRLVEIKKPVLTPPEGNASWPNTVHIPDRAVPLSPFQQCRLLLSHLGYLPFEHRKQFQLLKSDDKFYRSLIALDKILPREIAKIGLIYVQKGQQDQKAILRNNTKSPLYEDFVNGLAWSIDLASHRGYLGGLEKKGSTGTKSPYFATYSTEVIFHDITGMPTVEGDDQQILKKRHVGNDIIHIVWSEHSRDYRPSTITSQFNDAHIVIYPLPTGLFRVQIFKKDERLNFGPLIDGMTVSKLLLPQLVRQTSCNANKAVRVNTPGYVRPFVTRRKAISELITRSKQANLPFQEVMREIIHYRKTKRAADLTSPAAKEDDKEKEDAKPQGSRSKDAEKP